MIVVMIRVNSFNVCMDKKVLGGLVSYMKTVYGIKYHSETVRRHLNYSRRIIDDFIEIPTGRHINRTSVLVIFTFSLGFSDRKAGLLFFAPLETWLPRLLQLLTIIGTGRPGHGLTAGDYDLKVAICFS